MLFVDRVPVVLWRKLVVLNQITNNLVEIGVDALVNLEAKSQRNLEQEVCAKIVNNKLACIWVICQRDVNEVVGFARFGRLSRME